MVNWLWPTLLGAFACLGMLETYKLIFLDLEQELQTQSLQITEMSEVVNNMELLGTCVHLEEVPTTQHKQGFSIKSVTFSFLRFF